MNLQKIEFEVFTVSDSPPLEPFELGVSYCYPKKIKEPLLSVPEIYEILKKPIFHHLAKKFFNSEKVFLTKFESILKNK